MGFLAQWAGLVAATLVESKASREAELETPPDVALAIQDSISAPLFAGMALFWGGLAPAVGCSTFGGYGFCWPNLKLSGGARVSSLVYLTPPPRWSGPI